MRTSIVDAHHHIWRQADLPWLQGPMQPRIFGPYDSIRRDYLIDEYLADLTGHGVQKSVYVQANWASEAFENEVRWVQHVADVSGWPHAVVAYADFCSEDVRWQLDRLVKYPLMRGLRMQLHWHENAKYRFAVRSDLAVEEHVQRNVARLADYGWSFDLQVFPGQMADASRLADACPNVTFVLQHAGMLEDRTPAGWSAWETGMAELATRPNVVSKLSAFGTFIHRNDPDHIQDMVDQTLVHFGPQRCLFGSNFPIEKIWTSYAELMSAHQTAVNRHGEEVADAVFKSTAERVYRLGEA
ncbi:MAG: amidohydrolase family protein [Hyphomicrobiaceae bacterium]